MLNTCKFMSSCPICLKLHDKAQHHMKKLNKPVKLIECNGLLPWLLAAGWKHPCPCHGCPVHASEYNIS